MTSNSTRKTSAWFDETSNTPLIDREARRLQSFLAAVADGRVDAAEVSAQQDRLVKLMKELEPLLDDNLHAKVTELLCELTAYDLMQVMHAMHEARPRTTFKG